MNTAIGALPRPLLNCRPTFRPPSPQYVVGIPTDEFEFRAQPQSVGRQQMSNWCWAACIQMVLNFHGLPVQQSALVADTYGTLLNRPAEPFLITSALTGSGRDEQGVPVQVRPEMQRLDNRSVINDLAQRRPLIVGFNGHAYVLTGAYFHEEGPGNPVIDRVILRDPWPFNPSRVEKNMSEIGRFSFATRVQVNRPTN